MANYDDNDESNWIEGSEEDDVIRGNGGDDTIDALGGNDYIDGGTGADTLFGGDGNDTYVVDNDGDMVVEFDTPEGGIDKVYSSVDFWLSDGIENLTLIGGVAINGFGSEGDNVIIGNDAENTLRGEGGNDQLNGKGGVNHMYGGAGNDVYVVNSVDDYVSESLTVGVDDGGVDRVVSTINYTLPDFVENLTLADNPALVALNLGQYSFMATGNSLNNVIRGNTQDNIIDGKEGADIMRGGLGNDHYYVDNVGDRIQENFGEGYDYVHTSVSFDMEGKNVDEIWMTGTNNINVYGNANSNFIYGNDGNNYIDGRGGGDVMSGGHGDDTYVMRSLGDVIQEGLDWGNDTILTDLSALYLQQYIENYRFIGSGNDWAYGNYYNNVMRGGDNQSVLFGADGDDTLFGNGGDDFLFSGTGTDTLYGGNGNDRLDAHFTASRRSDLYGGAGNDTYLVDYLVLFNGSIISEDNGSGGDAGGIDTVEFWASSPNLNLAYYLGDYFENLILRGAQNNNNGYGNALDNKIYGSAASNGLFGGDGNDYLNAGGGDDTMMGGAGDDIYVVDTINDYVSEESQTGVDDGGFDSVRSFVSYNLGAFIEYLTLIGTDNIDGHGNGLNNRIAGNDGNNRLVGAGGNDSLKGGLGDDTYVFSWGFGRDTVTDIGGADTIEFVDGITAADIMTAIVGDDLYIGLKDSAQPQRTALNAANRIKVVGGAASNLVEIISYASGASAPLVQALIGFVPSTGETVTETVKSKQAVNPILASTNRLSFV